MSAKRFDPTLKYIGTGEYVPSMEQVAGGDYVLYAYAAELERQLVEAKALAKAGALEEIPAMVRGFCADQGWDEGYLHNLETLIRDKAAEYRAKANGE